MYINGILMQLLNSVIPVNSNPCQSVQGGVCPIQLITCRHLFYNPLAHDYQHHIDDYVQYPGSGIAQGAVCKLGSPLFVSFSGI